MLKIFWFRKDLRVIDNRGLYEFVKSVTRENQFSFLYIKNRNTFNYYGQKRIGFLIECLRELKDELETFGFNLQIAEGKSFDVLKKIVDEYKTVSLFCNKQVEPYCIARDSDVKELIEDCGGQFNSFTDTTIFESGEIKNGDGGQYKVFTPFKNQCLNTLNKSYYKKSETDLSLLKNSSELKIKALEIYNLEKEYRKFDKSEFLKGGRKEGIKFLKIFYESGLEKYKSKRNFPSEKGTSLLSAHLHFGTVGIRECFRTAFVKLYKAKDENAQDAIQTWIKELLWREFYYNITFHNPQIAYESFKKEYDNFKWDYDEKMFRKWCEGKTGYPIVDAGMRELNE
ncbi:MAG: deoxyribodipyrimidine photo-lyase, partial [bacterium]